MLAFVIETPMAHGVGSAPGERDNQLQSVTKRLGCHEWDTTFDVYSSRSD